MALHHHTAPLAAVAFLAASLSGPALAQQLTGEQARSRDTRGVVLGLAALAAIGIALREFDDDEESRLPPECLANWPTAQGRMRLYDPDCLGERFHASAELPLACAVVVRSQDRFRSGFSPECLREEGWQARN